MSLPFFSTRALSKYKISPFDLVENSVHSASALSEKVSRNIVSNSFIFKSTEKTPQRVDEAIRQFIGTAPTTSMHTGRRGNGIHNLTAVGMSSTAI